MSLLTCWSNTAQSHYPWDGRYWNHIRPWRCCYLFLDPELGGTSGSYLFASGLRYDTYLGSRNNSIEINRLLEEPSWKVFWTQKRSMLVMNSLLAKDCHQNTLYLYPTQLPVPMMVRMLSTLNGLSTTSQYSMDNSYRTPHWTNFQRKGYWSVMGQFVQYHRFLRWLNPFLMKRIRERQMNLVLAPSAS